MDPLPVWYPPLGETAGTDFPVHALTQRPMAMYHSWGSQNAWLRQIHGENPLYLPQAKVYARCCALSPLIALHAALPAPTNLAVGLKIIRAGAVLFSDSTSTRNIVRPYAELIAYLGRDNLFPAGVVLLTGTGIVPPDAISLQAGDEVVITIEGIGELRNPVVLGA